MKPATGAVLLAFTSAMPTGASAMADTPMLAIQNVSQEEVIFDSRRVTCGLEQFPDSPARAIREAGGEIVLFATFETNWFMAGPDWASLRPTCVSAGRGAENSDPRATDDKFWIQALYSKNGRDVLALGSHEYLGTRHPGQCVVTEPEGQRPPCWFSSITQYVSKGDARHFKPAAAAPIVAAPQESYSPRSARRVGFFTTSNIIADRDHLYVLVYGEGMAGQPKGNCLFRTERSGGASRWLGWDGTGFTVDLSKLGAAPNKACRPVEGLHHEARSLMRHRESGKFVTIFTSRDRSTTGVFYSVSDDMKHWGAQKLLLEAPLTRQEPGCEPVYRYPSLIDHDAPEQAFESIGNRAFLYSVKIILDGCHQSGRLITRSPVTITAGGT
jgi:hypothetical protein